MWLPTAERPKQPANDSPATAKLAASESSKDSVVRTALPDAPIAKSDATAESISAIKPFSSGAIKPAMERPVPTPRQQKLWYTFMAVGHSAAVFDAYSTRRAISGNYGTESNPFLRP